MPDLYCSIRQDSIHPLLQGLSEAGFNVNVKVQYISEFDSDDIEYLECYHATHALENMLNDLIEDIDEPSGELTDKSIPK